MNPTPAQARALKVLIEHPAVRIVWRRYQAAWIGPSSWNIEREFGTLRSATVRALLRDGWIKLDPDDRFETTYGISDEGRGLVDALAPDDFISTPAVMTAGEVAHAVTKHFGRGWWIAEEVTDSDWSGRRIDMLALRINGGEIDLDRYLTLWAIEIKIDPSDVKRELEEPAKRQPFERLANYFALAAPAGLVMPANVPEGVGLLEVHDGQHVRMAIKPQRTVALAPTWRLVAAMARSHLKRNGYEG